MFSTVVFPRRKNNEIPKDSIFRLKNLFETFFVKKTIINNLGNSRGDYETEKKQRTNQMARNYVITTPSFCDLKLLKEECYIPFSDETATIMIDATGPLSPGLPDLNFVPIRVMKDSEIL